MLIFDRLSFASRGPFLCTLILHGRIQELVLLLVDQHQIVVFTGRLLSLLICLIQGGLLEVYILLPTINAFVYDLVLGSHR